MPPFKWMLYLNISRFNDFDKMKKKTILRVCGQGLNIFVTENLDL